MAPGRNRRGPTLQTLAAAMATTVGMVGIVMTTMEVTTMEAIMETVMDPNQDSQTIINPVAHLSQHRHSIAHLRPPIHPISQSSPTHLLHTHPLRRANLLRHRLHRAYARPLLHGQETRPLAVFHCESDACCPAYRDLRSNQTLCGLQR
jgi:hypothetical protein